MIYYSLKITLLMSIFQLLNSNENDQNYSQYDVIDTIDDIEIRHYHALVFASYSDQDNSYNNFSVLADYIFGGNDQNVRLEMTSPVTSKMDGSRDMLFILPKYVTIENHPKPNNQKIEVFRSKIRMAASLRFSGYADDDICAVKKGELIQLLKQNNIQHEGDFELLVYDPPYRNSNRINEILVSIKQ